jgi:chemotaxis-related protein WspB
MLLLTMNIGTERFGIDATHVIEVIPLVKLEHVPRVDHCISGIFNYRGVPVPVIDLCVFFDNRRCRNNLSSRIILTQITMPDGSQKTIGLLAERITEVIKCDSKDFNKSVINSANAQFLQYLYQRENEILQIIDVKKVIPDSISRQLSTTEH